MHAKNKLFYKCLKSRLIFHDKYCHFFSKVSHTFWSTCSYATLLFQSMHIIHLFTGSFWEAKVINNEFAQKKENSFFKKYNLHCLFFSYTLNYLEQGKQYKILLHFLFSHQFFVTEEAHHFSISEHNEELPDYLREA